MILSAWYCDCLNLFLFILFFSLHTGVKIPTLSHTLILLQMKVMMTIQVSVRLNLATYQLE